jgi:hypothetical protein
MTTTTPATTAAPTAEITAWTELIVITITDAPPFDLPTLGAFGGYGDMPDPGQTLNLDDVTPYQFTVGRVEVEIGESEIIGYAAFPKGSSIVWRGVTDASEDHRKITDHGVHRKHWPAWLTDLVDQTIARHDPRAELPEACPDCGSVELSWAHTTLVTGGARRDGYLRAADVTALFELRCDSCTRAVGTMTADQAVEAMNVAGRPLLVHR